MFWKINRRENWGELERSRVPLFTYTIRQKNTHKYGKGDMRKKKLINRRNDITQGWQFWSFSIALVKEREKIIKVTTTRGICIWSPIQILTLPYKAELCWADETCCCPCGISDSPMNSFFFFTFRRWGKISKRENKYLILHGWEKNYRGI